MKLTVTYQERYSRSELLLRSIFGVFYIVMPHFFFSFLWVFGAVSCPLLPLFLFC